MQISSCTNLRTTMARVDGDHAGWPVVLRDGLRLGLLSVDSGDGDRDRYRNGRDELGDSPNSISGRVLHRYLLRVLV